MDIRNRQRRYAIFAIFMAAMMAITAILPALAPTSTTQPVDQPTQTPAPTFPAPPSDLSSIVFDQTYLHPSGLYTVSYPENWTPSRPSNNGTQVQVNFENTAFQSVIEQYVDVPVPAITNLQDLSARFDRNTLQAGWRSYSSWEETSREIDTANNAVVIDFELTLNNLTYLARHYAELGDDGWIYVTRVVTPDNARALLLDLLAKAKGTVEPVALFADTPVMWSSYYSDQDNVVVRYPNNWVVRDGGPGEPVTIENTNQAVLNVQTLTGTTIASEEDASAYVLSQRPNAEIQTVEAVERNGGSGFEVSYTFRNLEGEPQSAITVLLNDGEDTVRVATVRVLNQNLDLLDTDSQTLTVTDAIKVTETFNLTTDLGFPVETVDDNGGEAES